MNKLFWPQKSGTTETYVRICAFTYVYLGELLNTITILDNLLSLCQLQLLLYSYIDVKGTTQEAITKEVIDIAAKKLGVKHGDISFEVRRW